MIFSLRRKFLVLVLLPTALIVVGAGVAGWTYARKFLLDQWAELIHLRLEKAANQIAVGMEEKLGLIRLIVRAEDYPNHELLQTFLIQQLVKMSGVRLVEVDPTTRDDIDIHAQRAVEGGYTLDLFEKDSPCHALMRPNVTDRSLEIVTMINARKGLKRVTVIIDLGSFLVPLGQIGLSEGSTAFLITKRGQVLAQTDGSMVERKKVGDTGDELEAQVLQEIREESFGTVLGKGRPPERVAGYCKIPSTNWYLLLISQGSVLLAPVHVFRNFYVAGAMTSLAVTLLLIGVTTRSVSRSIAEICAATEKVQTGDYSLRLPYKMRDEIGLLRARFNQMVEGLKRREVIEQTFGRYMDKSVAEKLINEAEALRLGGEKRTVTIMMSDLRNFTSISEKLQPEEVIKMLNRYFGRMISIIERHKGIIVDFYGDSILVFFDGAETEVSARALDAVQCALEMQQDMKGFIDENLASGLPEASMGIGVNTGEVIVGNIGAESRAKYGIVGSNVNLTDRIQSTASGGKVVISERTFEAIGQRQRTFLEFKACLKGVETEKKLYEIESLKEELEDEGIMVIDRNYYQRSVSPGTQHRTGGSN